MIWCSPYEKTEKNEGPIKRFFTKCFYRIVNTGDGPALPVDAGDFRLLNRKVINAILACQERVRFMKGLYAWVGFKTKALEYTPKDRKHGITKWGRLSLVRHAIIGIISFTDVPLKIWTGLGFVIAMFSLLYGAYNIFMALTHHVNTPGFPTLVSAIFFFGGIQLISIGILGEYLARVFQEVKKRPAYIIRDIDEHQ